MAKERSYRREIILAVGICSLITSLLWQDFFTNANCMSEKFFHGRHSNFCIHRLQKTYSTEKKIVREPTDTIVVKANDYEAISRSKTDSYGALLSDLVALDESSASQEGWSVSPETAEPYEEPESVDLANPPFAGVADVPAE